MKPERAKLLGELLDEAAAEMRATDMHPIPEEAFEPLHRLVPYPAIDMVIFADDLILLVDREDKYFKGWELVGGYGHWHDESMQAWCSRLALRDIGADVELRGFTGVHRWQPGEHAHGAPTSIVAACTLRGEPDSEKSVIGLFSPSHVPYENMVPNHGTFIRQTLAAMESGALVPEI